MAMGYKSYFFVSKGIPKASVETRTLPARMPQQILTYEGNKYPLPEVLIQMSGYQLDDEPHHDLKNGCLMHYPRV